MKPTLAKPRIIIAEVDRSVAGSSAYSTLNDLPNSAIALQRNILKCQTLEL